jgi:hypothetical protein
MSERRLVGKLRVAAIPKPRSQRASGETSTFRRAESGITVELA